MTNTVTIPPRVRFGLYVALGVINVFLTSWSPSFGHEDVVDYGVKAVAGLSALLFGVAATKVTKDEPVEPSTAP